MGHSTSTSLGPIIASRPLLHTNLYGPGLSSTCNGSATTHDGHIDQVLGVGQHGIAFRPAVLCMPNVLPLSLDVSAHHEIDAVICVKVGEYAAIELEFKKNVAIVEMCGLTRTASGIHTHYREFTSLLDFRELTPAETQVFLHSLATWSPAFLQRLTSLNASELRLGASHMYVAECTLQHVIDRTSTISNENLRTMLLRLAVSLRFLHAHGVWHLDIKPDNIFIMREEGKLDMRFADFGLAVLRNGGGVHHSIPQEQTYFTRHEVYPWTLHFVRSPYLEKPKYWEKYNIVSGDDEKNPTVLGVSLIETAEEIKRERNDIYQCLSLEWMRHLQYYDKKPLIPFKDEESNMTPNSAKNQIATVCDWFSFFLLVHKLQINELLDLSDGQTTQLRSFGAECLRLRMLDDHTAFSCISAILGPSQSMRVTVRRIIEHDTKATSKKPRHAS